MEPKIIFGGCIIVVTVLVICYLYYENTTLEITNYIIENDKIPFEFNNYKIVQISDYHNEKSSKINDNLVNEIKRLKPNIIVLTGDLVDSRRTDINVVIDLIKKLKNMASIYYVTGNHEARINNYEELKEKLQKENLIVLDNKCTTVNIGDSKLNLIGIDDPNMEHDSGGYDFEIVNKQMQNIYYDKDMFSILLSHRPEVFNIYVENNIDLIFTGHAHGGQIRIPFLGGVISPNQGFFPKYTSGIFKDNNTNMIVSRGIGNSLFPFRINNRPELVVVTLISNNKSI